jgi:hypothetical protein
MADISVNIYEAVTNREGVSTPVQGVISGDPLPDPLNPTNGTNQHNSLSGLQGGAIGEYYHLTDDEYDAVLNANAPDAGNPFATIADLGGGGLPPIDGSYASQAAMIADQVNQTAQYIYYDGTAYWEYLGTTTPSIADYRQISGGGSFDGNPSSLNQEGATDGQAIVWNNTAMEWQPQTVLARDPDAVHYDASDGKSLSERQQANNNMKSVGLNVTTNATAGRLDDIPTPTDVIVITASTDLTGFVPTETGFLRIVCKNGTFCLIRNNSTFSGVVNRVVGLSSNVRINNNSYFDLFYDTAQSRWIPMGYQQIKANGAAGNANANSFRGNSSIQSIPIFEVINSAGTVLFNVRGDGLIVTLNMPTSNPGIAGALWNDLGTVKIS